MDDSLNTNLAKQLATMDRNELVGFIRNLKCTFEMDFTDNFLGSMSLGRLRHVAAAATLHARVTKSVPIGHGA
jgi:hypothetical protein